MTELFARESIKNLKDYYFDLSLELECIDSDDLRTIHDTILCFYQDYDCSESYCPLFDYYDFETLIDTWIDCGGDFEDVFKNYLNSVKEDEDEDA